MLAKLEHHYRQMRYIRCNVVVLLLLLFLVFLWTFITSCYVLCTTWKMLRRLNNSLTLELNIQHFIVIPYTGHCMWMLVFSWVTICYLCQSVGKSFIYWLSGYSCNGKCSIISKNWYSHSFCKLLKLLKPYCFFTKM